MIEEKITAIGFSVETSLSPEGIREAGQRAAEAGFRKFISSIEEIGFEDGLISYRVKVPDIGGPGTAAVFSVSWEEHLDGSRRRVTLEVRPENCEIYQERMMGFIPAGPKKATALKSLQRFGEVLKVELAAD